MRIAIVHYHLKRGGVTRVVENTLSALIDKGVDVVVLAAENSGLSEEFGSHFVAVPELAYKSVTNCHSASELEGALRRAAGKALNGAPDLWHVHNHHLAKNTSLTGAVAAMAGAGERLLLHIHDFPEDGRPGNYQTLRNDLADGDNEILRQILYPMGAQIFYGVLNRRDFDVLNRAGVPECQIQLLPNPVSTPCRDAPLSPLPELSFDRLILYPTRAIRRKNLGETLLWSAVAPPGDLFGCTLAPDNPAAKPIYQRWVDRATEWGLPIEFELGKRMPVSFDSLVLSSDSLITTSVAEGFGLAFLEPWAFGRPLLGRNLPDITSDFVDVGLDLGALYDRLDVPLAWIDQDLLRAELSATLRKSYQQYSLELPEHSVDKTFKDLIAGDVIDFGRLGEGIQEEIILKVMGDSGCAKALQPQCLSESLSTEHVAHNETVARERFSLDQYGRRLMDCYSRLVNIEGTPIEWAEPASVLDQFLSPAAFNFLRS